MERRKEIVRNLDKGLSADKRIQVLPHEGKDYESSRHLYITRVQGASYDQRGKSLQKWRNVAFHVTFTTNHFHY